VHGTGVIGVFVGCVLFTLAVTGGIKIRIAVEFGLASIAAKMKFLAPPAGAGLAGICRHLHPAHRVSYGVFSWRLSGLGVMSTGTMGLGF